MFAQLFKGAHLASKEYGRKVVRVYLVFEDGERLRLPVPPPATLDAGFGSTFIPGPIQEDILAALEGETLFTAQLVAKLDIDKRTLFRDPGGIQELRRQGLVDHHKQFGYFRPDAPPAALKDRKPSQHAFVPTTYQKAILEALDGQGMRTNELGDKLGDKRRLYKPNGIMELKAEGLVTLHPRVGYYRPDAPPPELRGVGKDPTPEEIAARAAEIREERQPRLAVMG